MMHHNKLLTDKSLDAMFERNMREAERLGCLEPGEAERIIRDFYEFREKYEGQRGDDWWKQ